MRSLMWHLLSAYTLRHIFIRYESFLFHAAKVINLIYYLIVSGQDIINAGFVPSLNSGVLTAGAVLHRNLFKDVANLPKEIKIKNPKDVKRD